MLGEFWKVAKRDPISAAWMSAVFVVSIIIVWQAGKSRAGSDDIAKGVLATVSIISVLFSMVFLTYTRRFLREKRYVLVLAFAVGGIICEGNNILAEATWGYGRFLVTEARDHVAQAQISANLAVIEKARATLDELKNKKFRGERQIQADINAALTRTVDVGHNSFQTVAKLTKNCTDTASSYSGECAKVYELQGELAASQQAPIDFEKAKADVSTYTIDADKLSAPADASGMVLASLSSRISRDSGTVITIWIAVAILTCLRIGIGPVFVLLFEEKDEKRDHREDVGRLAPAGDARAAGMERLEADTPPAPMLPPSGPKPKKPTTVEPSAAVAVLSTIASVQAAERASARPARAVGSTEAFYFERTKSSKGAEHAAGDFRNAYLAWCEAKGFEPMKVSTFREESKRFVRKAKGKRGDLKNRCVYHDRALIGLVPSSAAA